MRQSSMEQYFAAIFVYIDKSMFFSTNGTKTSNHLAESYLIFNDRLLNLHLVEEIKLYVALCKIYLAGTWVFRVSHSGWAPHPTIFFETLPIKTDAPLKNEAPYWKTTSRHPLKSKAPFQETISRKNPEKLETVINTCVSLIKRNWKMMAEQEHDFIWSIRNFVRKVKYFVRKYI